MSRAVAVIGLLIFAVIALNGISTQYQSTVADSQPETNIVDEEFDVVKNTTIVLNESRRDVVYNDSVVVNQAGAKVSEDDYRWQPGNGTLFIPENSTMDENDNATIDYNFTEPSDEQRAVRDVMLMPAELGRGIGALAGAILLVGGFAYLRRVA